MKELYWSVVHWLSKRGVVGYGRNIPNGKFGADLERAAKRDKQTWHFSAVSFRRVTVFVEYQAKPADKPADLFGEEQTPV
ncbi:hypothetical protein CH253_08185 [Rhodococcus sp. 06-156-3C]|uniref:hypothetical protein n=1 Tax=Rhodococcus sp. 06-156-3C TaxID=2022486 RepID=UPI000B9A52D5|nr:hypothetical protein [Rhodococcus sp. 06-156-3C]OZD23831.1 hypothetical protein CH253_08185 [Rhodococcus sp. 06-156-3C]